MAQKNNFVNDHADYLHNRSLLAQPCSSNSARIPSPIFLYRLVTFCSSRSWYLSAIVARRIFVLSITRPQLEQRIPIRVVSENSRTKNLGNSAKTPYLSRLFDVSPSLKTRLIWVVEATSRWSNTLNSKKLEFICSKEDSPW